MHLGANGCNGLQLSALALFFLFSVLAGVIARMLEECRVDAVEMTLRNNESDANAGLAGCRVRGAPWKRKRVVWASKCFAVEGSATPIEDRKEVMEDR